MFFQIHSNNFWINITVNIIFFKYLLVFQSLKNNRKYYKVDSQISFKKKKNQTSLTIAFVKTTVICLLKKSVIYFFLTINFSLIHGFFFLLCSFECYKKVNKSIKLFGALILDSTSH